MRSRTSKSLLYIFLGENSNMWNVKNLLFMLDIKPDHGNGNFINKDKFFFKGNKERGTHMLVTWQTEEVQSQVTL